MKNPPSPRRLAIDVLSNVLERAQPFDSTFDSHKDLVKLAARDRAFARQLIATTLRRLGQIDAIIRQCTQRPVPRKAQAIQHILRIGIAQLLFLNTPPHAAVSTSVELARTFRLHGFAKMINAVLRRVEREGAAMVASQDAGKLNTPAWLWQSWTEAYSEDTCRQIAAAHLEEPPLDLSFKGDGNEWAAANDAVLLPNGTVRLHAKGSITDLPGYKDGQWWVQDMAAALPVHLLGDVAGKRVLDLCAAPGGKTAQLAAKGAQVTALDRTEARMARLRDNLKRLNLNADIVVADTLTYKPKTPFDAVLLDAPCSATGTIRRHPDIPWVKSASDIRDLARQQLKLLAAAASMVKPGGTLVFCTCSLQPEEGPDIVAQALAQKLPLEPLPVDDPVLQPYLTSQGWLRTLPDREADLDGFFGAAFQRTGM